MKKTIFYGLVLAILVIPMVSFGATSTLPEGCKEGYKFSVTTGQSCSGIPDCLPGHLFSALNGRPCTTDTIVGKYDDRCPNIEGLQTTVPPGAESVDGKCVPRPDATLKKEVAPEKLNPTPPAGPCYRGACPVSA